MAESSTVARWELALRIKARRKELDINVGTIAQHLAFSRNFFSAVENERAMLAPEKLEAIMELLLFSDDEREEMRHLDRVGRKRGWWESHEELLGVEAARYLGLEQGASEIRVFESLAIAGLLQTPEYMHAVFDRDPLLGRLRTRDAIQIREQRQQSIIKSGRLIKMLVSEASLVQIWGDNQIQAEQLSKVLATIESTDLEVRILPFDRSPGPIATSSTLIMLDFKSRHLPSLIWQEPLRSVDFVEEGHEHYDRIRIAWEEGYEGALDAEDSVQKIQEIRELFSRTAN